MAYSLSDIQQLCFNAYLLARRNERTKNTQLAFEIDFEKKVSSLAWRLYNRIWTPSPPIVFPKLDPVPREIFAPVFEDRIVSLIAFTILNPIFEQLFIFDSASCRKGKGTMFGVSRFEHHIRSITNNWQREAYVLDLDISGYFMSIDRALLLDMVFETIDRYKWVIKDVDWLKYIVKEIILRDPIKDCKRMGDWRLMSRVPKRKRIEYSKPGCGLIPGDVDSQLFSNFYMNKYDHFVKRFLHIKHYIRYVDDARLLHLSKEYLEECLNLSREFMEEKLHLTLHATKCKILSTNEENEFLGKSVRPFYTTISQDSARRLYRNLLNTNKEETSISTLNSYMGYTRDKKCRRLVNAALRRTDSRSAFVFEGNNFKYKQERILT